LRTYFDVYKKHAATMVRLTHETVKKNEEKKTAFDITSLITCAGLDIIAETACGFHANAQEGPNVQYTRTVKEVCRPVS